MTQKEQTRLALRQGRKRSAHPITLFGALDCLRWFTGGNDIQRRSFDAQRITTFGAQRIARSIQRHTAEPRSQRLIRSRRTPVESEKGLLRCVLCCFPRSRQTVHNPVDHRIMAHEQIVERRLITPPEPFEERLVAFVLRHMPVACPYRHVPDVAVCYNHT